MKTSITQRACLLAALLTFNGVIGFSPNRAALYHRAPAAVAFRPSIMPLAALIYGPDGAVEMEDWDDVEEELHVLEQNHASLGMSKVLTQEQIASLAKMAAAFSPPGHKLDIKHINDIEILNVGHDRIEISAVVCEADGCATTRVPITFPNPCTMSEGIDTCITQNLGELDQKAEGLIRDMELKEENKDDDEFIWKTLTSTEDIDLPTWWELSPAMTQDCDNIRRLLNEEGFQAEIRGVATKALTEIMDHTEKFSVRRAAVVAVCPSGIHMRALVKKTTALGDEESKFVQVPLAFGRPALDGDALRTEVLSTVDAASVYVE